MLWSKINITILFITSFFYFLFAFRPSFIPCFIPCYNLIAHLFLQVLVKPEAVVDEDLEILGEQLALPPFLEPHRAKIEAGLKPIETALAYQEVI